MIGPIVAMPVSESGFRHPALSINGRETVFPVSMPIGSYLEAEEDGSLHPLRQGRLGDLRADARRPRASA